MKRFDHMFYMDVDYWVCNVPPESDLLVDGIVGVSHLHNLYPHKGPHVGSPDTNPKSMACVKPKEKMTTYFSGGFQGGSASAMLQACRTIKSRIDQDDAKGVLALWHDESHWNRYLLDHPPAKTVSQSYVYPEQCLVRSCTEENCKQLRQAGVVPLMVALDKDHRAVRA